MFLLLCMWPEYGTLCSVPDRTINSGTFHEVLLARWVHLNVVFSYCFLVYIYLFSLFGECFSDIYKFVNLIAFLLYVSLTFLDLRLTFIFLLFFCILMVLLPIFMISAISFRLSTKTYLFIIIYWIFWTLVFWLHYFRILYLLCMWPIFPFFYFPLSVVRQNWKNPC